MGAPAVLLTTVGVGVGCLAAPELTALEGAVIEVVRVPATILLFCDCETEPDLKAGGGDFGGLVDI